MTIEYNDFVIKQIKFMYGKYYEEIIKNKHINDNIKNGDITIENILNDKNIKDNGSIIYLVKKYWKKTNLNYFLRCDWRDCIKKNDFIITHNRQYKTNDQVIFLKSGYTTPEAMYIEDKIDFKFKKNSIIFRGATSGCFNMNSNIQKVLRVKFMNNNFNINKNIDIGFSRFIGLTDENKTILNKYYKEPLSKNIQLEYKFILNIEGNDYASSFPWVLASNCCPLHNYPFSWESYIFGQDLLPWIHFIPVNNDGTDLLEKYNWCIQNLEKCEEIANNGKKYMEPYLDKILNEKILKYFFELYPLRTIS